MMNIDDYDTDKLFSVDWDQGKTADELLSKLEQELKRQQGGISCNFIELGTNLLKVKKILGHGNWQEWVDKHLDISSRSASRYMSLAYHFRDKPEFHALGVSKLLILLTLGNTWSLNPFTERYNIYDIEDMSRVKLAQAVKEYNYEHNGGWVRERIARDAELLKPKPTKSSEKKKRSNLTAEKITRKSHNAIEEIVNQIEDTEYSLRIVFARQLRDILKMALTRIEKIINEPTPETENETE
jgi:hypothetical protein